jgi:uncharacterized membrane protein YdjX (TVP38/TMEM64 family)
MRRMILTARKKSRTNHIKMSPTILFSIAMPLALALGYLLLLADLVALSSVPDGAAQEAFSSPGSMEELVEGFGAWSLLVFLLMQAAQVVAGPVPAAPVIAAGSAIFGFWEGLTLSMVGITAGSVCAFLIGRRFGRPLLGRLLTEKTLARYRETPVGSDGWWLLMVLLLPVPAGGDAACALAGLSSISLRRFVVVVSVGRLPGTALAAFVGANLVSGRVFAVVTAGLTTLVVVGVALRYRRRMEAWLVQGGQVGHVGEEVSHAEQKQRAQTVTKTRRCRAMLENGREEEGLLVRAKPCS